ncbi:hypothetical protein DFH09DRAFT_1162460 [Mycena vulgaris]|nr:hypothetical protein DFH09DRAFT_1162460 [Mycena vulgaris]
MPSRTTRTVRFEDADDEADTASSLPTSLHSRVIPAPSPETTVPTHLRHSRPLYACKPLPVADVELHPILKINLESAELFDVCRDPSYQVPAHLQPSAVTAPATYPPTTRMSLICPRLPWRIEVQSAEARVVSAADVRDAIHSALAAPVTRPELLATPTVDRPVISMAFEARCERMRHEFGPGAAQVEMQLGIKRVDFLLGSGLFVGLSAIPDTPDVWEMIFSS